MLLLSHTLTTLLDYGTHTRCPPSELIDTADGAKVTLKSGEKSKRIDHLKEPDHRVRTASNMPVKWA